jgi:SAM-dependent methyltransferase
MKRDEQEESMATQAHEGTSRIQGPLWSERADDWAEIQEPLMRPAFEAALDALAIGPDTRLLDVGCGSGFALRLAADGGATVTGLDASATLLEHARRRVPGAPLVQGELEDLPFEADSFDVVTGFNSFQYAARPAAALAEAVRVLAPGGRVLYLNWAPPDQSEASAYLAAIGKLLPPPPPGAPGPFALSDAEAIVRVFGEGGLDVTSTADVTVEWTYPDQATAIAGLMSSGPVVRAIHHAGEEAVVAAIADFLEPFRTDDGGYRITNVFRYAIGNPC